MFWLYVNLSFFWTFLFILRVKIACCNHIFDDVVLCTWYHADVLTLSVRRPNNGVLKKSRGLCFHVGNHWMVIKIYGLLQ